MTPSPSSRGASATAPGADEPWLAAVWPALK